MSNEKKSWLFSVYRGLYYPVHSVDGSEILLQFVGPGSWNPTLYKVFQGIGKDVPRSQRTPSWEIPKKSPI